MQVEQLDGLPTITPQSVLSAYAAGGEGLFRITASIEKAAPNSKHRRRISGVASTPDKDLQDETVRSEGLDATYFLKSGYYNWNHSHDPGDLVGYPEVARATANEFYTEGYLLENHKKADDVWELMNSLELSKADRKLGMSIEGVVTERHFKDVRKAIVRQIALTYCPINQSTYVDIVKALGMVAKSLSTNSGTALRVENLDMGVVTSTLFTTKCKRCYTSDGRFKKGVRGAYAHMVECNGFAPKESQQFLRHCVKAVGTGQLHPAWLIALGFVGDDEE